MVNHSEDPNASQSLEEGSCKHSSYADRDIKAGEMFTEDYGTFDYPDWYNELCTTFSIDRSFVGKLNRTLCSSAKDDKLTDEINSQI